MEEKRPSVKPHVFIGHCWHINRKSSVASKRTFTGLRFRMVPDIEEDVLYRDQADE